MGSGNGGTRNERGGRRGGSARGGGASDGSRGRQACFNQHLDLPFTVPEMVRCLSFWGNHMPLKVYASGGFHRLLRTSFCMDSAAYYHRRG